MRNKLMSLAAVVILAASLMGVRPVVGAELAPSVQVAITNGYVGEFEEYRINFLLDREVRAGETISIVFDDSINRAGFRELAAEDIMIDEVLAGTSASWSGHTLAVTVPSVLSAGTVHEMRILRSAMVQNPWTAMHVRLLLRDDAVGTVLVSNYYGISTVTRVSPVSLTVDTPRADRLTVVVRFKTGQNGALIGTPATRFPPSGATASDTIAMRLSPALSALWDQTGTPDIWLSTLPYGLMPRRLPLLVTTDRFEDQPDRYQKELVIAPDKSIGTSTEVEVRLEFDGVRSPVQLTTEDFVLVWTTKEPTMVRIPLTGVPDPAPGDGGEEPEPDTTAPLVRWTVQASSVSSRLVTVSVDITEANLHEAYFVTGADGSLRTWLTTGHNELLVINRSGIRGTIVAIDDARNTTRVPVDIPAAPATSGT
ncbi:MAG: hypothetical protein Q7V53_02445 [Caldisericota bacterium]|nr:hypothetical protein [Caldisericota bacterium]